MTARLLGRKVTALTIDRHFEREYKVEFKVETDGSESVVAAALCPGLPQPGNQYNIGSEFDIWAWCGPEMSIKEVITEGEPNNQFIVERTFSTKNTRICAEYKQENPLLEPPKISWSFRNSKEEATTDLNGKFILNSAHEMLRGPQVEFDISVGIIKIEQNVGSFYLAEVLPSGLKDCVNVSTLWGLPPRTVRLAGCSGEKLFYGACFAYYKRSLEFEVEYRRVVDPQGRVRISNWDRYLLDEGHKVLRGHWEATTGVVAGQPGVKWVLDAINGILPDYRNPRDFIKFPDSTGQGAKVILNGFGQPAGSDLTDYNTYVAIFDVPVGIALTDPFYWRPQTSGDQPWFATETYAPGNLVASNAGNLYIALTASTNIDPDGLQFPYWRALPDGLRDVGHWFSNTAYETGNTVIDIFSQGRQTQAGYIFVAKYPGVDFTPLGIPLVI